MSNILTSKSTNRLNLIIKIYPIHEYLVYLLFLWYIFFTGLGYTGIIPYYGIIDDLIFVLMLGSALMKLTLDTKRIYIHPWLFNIILAILTLCGFSLITNLSSPSLATKYVYIISRPFIVLIYISVLKLYLLV